jgi:hypothetical protein
MQGRFSVNPVVCLFGGGVLQKGRGSFKMSDGEKRLFVGVKISTQLQSGLDSPAPGTDRYFKEGNAEYLQIVTQGDEKFIGRYLKNGFPIADLDNVSRNVRSIIRLIAGDHRIEEDSVRIYVG